MSSRENPGAFSRYGIALLFVVSSLLMLRQLVTSSYFSVVVDDVLIYPSLAWQFSEALKEGIIYPRWLPLNFQGYGSPTFILYPPLAYYLTALLYTFTGSIVLAMNYLKWLTVFLNGVGMFYLLREFRPARVSLWGAIFYVTLPFNVAVMYIFGSFAATVSCAWFSPILLFIHRYFTRKEFRYLLYAGGCFGGLILTHLVTAYMFAFIMVAFVVFLCFPGKIRQGAGAIFTVLSVGSALSAAYLLPVILEKKYLNLDQFLGNEQGLVYSNLFLLPKMTDKLPAGYFWPVYYETIVFHVLYLAIVAVTFTLLSSNARQSEGCTEARAFTKFFLGVVCAAILLMTGFSSYVWETVPFFKYILFPSRWIHIATFAVAFLAVSPLSRTNSSSKAGWPWGSFLILALFAFNIAMDYYYVTRAPIYDRQELLPGRGVDCTPEHLPNNATFDGFAGENPAEKALIAHGSGQVTIETWKSAERVLKVDSGVYSTVRTRTFNFPGWTAYLDGRRTGLRSEEGSGAMLVDVPPGVHQLRLVFEDTPARSAGKIISAVSLALVMMAVMADRLLSGRRRWASAAGVRDPRSG